jgi:Tol biopolymer transport system component
MRGAANSKLMDKMLAPWRATRQLRAGRKGLVGFLVFAMSGAASFFVPAATANSPGRNGSLVVVAGGDIWTGRPDGTQQRQLTFGPASEACPAVSPSGLFIAFCRSNDVGYEVWIMDADGGNRRKLTDFGGNTASSDPTFSSSRPRVAFVFVRDFSSVGAAPGISYDIRSVRSDGTRVRSLTRSKAWHDFHPIFSPDGHRLLWVRTGAAPWNSGETQLWMMNGNGAKKHMIRADISRDEKADWSPDGRFIVYRSTGALMIVRADGTLLRRIASRGRNPVWSPNGRWIAYRVGSDIELIARDGRVTRPVTPFWANNLNLSDVFAWQPVPQ